MDELFQRIIANNYSDFVGLTVEASIPVSQHIINEIIAVALQGNTSIDSCQVSVGGQNRISVTLKTPLWPWPLNVKLRLYRSVDLVNSPKIRATLENNVLLGKLGSFFKALPDWAHLYEDQIVVDLGPFLRTPEQKRIVELIKSAEIRTEEGKAIFDVQIAVD